MLQLADRSIAYLEGVIEDVLLQIGKFIFLVDFIILDYEADEQVPIILGRPLLATGDEIIKVVEEEKLLRVLHEHKQAIGWMMSNIKGSSPAFCMDKILMEDEHKSCVEQQRRLNPIMKEVVRKEVIKWLDVRCEETKLVLNWEKWHYMVREVIILGHKVTKNGLEVDKSKVEAIEKLPPLTFVKGIRSFLGRASFYRCFIKDFSKISSPLLKFLDKDFSFKFDDACLKEFEKLKGRLENRDRVADGGSIKETYMNEHLLEITSNEAPWYEDYVNFIASRVTPPELIPDNKRIFVHDVRLYMWDDPFLYRQYADQLVRRCIPEEEMNAILHYFTIWRYILVAIDYVYKWVEAISLPTNNVKVVVNFVKKHIFTRFGTPKVLISDGGTHFCDKLLNNVLAKYGVKYKVSTAYQVVKLKCQIER
ncbi:uncharacterized protein [Nicotiana sylvestris]|uniref:uncharacterized protein n=1 Tax=Nicotiana sylvestris TaxID=4096 RepID=UPI00388C70ED